MEDKTDEELAYLTQKYNTQAFEVLVNRYELKLLNYGRRFVQDPEPIRDAVQEVFLKTYININSFNPDKKFSSWIYRIAHNEFVDVIKRQQREPYTLFNADIILALAGGEDPLAQLEHNELKEELDFHLAKLKPKYRDPIILFYFEDKSYDEISDILNIPVSTVGVRLKRARQQLKHYYDQKQ